MEDHNEHAPTEGHQITAEPNAAKVTNGDEGPTNNIGVKVDNVDIKHNSSGDNICVIAKDDNEIRVEDLDANDRMNGKIESNGKMEEIQLKNGDGNMLLVEGGGQRKSFMEEESARERARQALLKQCAAILRQSEEVYCKETLHRAFQDEDLLDRIFRLFDPAGRQSLAQDHWLEFLKQRVTEDKQLDFVEQVESVAYVLCGSSDVTPPAFRQILRNKVVTNKLLKAADANGNGSVSADEIMNFLSTITSSRSRAGFDRNSVDRLEQLFRATVGEQREITKEQFRSILDSKNPFFTERVFQIFDADDSGTISLQEFIAAAHRFAGQTPDDKIRFLFEVYDMDGDGLIQHRELQHVMWACMEENGMQFSDEQLTQLTRAMFEDADAEQRGAITYEALRRQLSKHDGLLENLSISIDRWLVPPKTAPTRSSWLQRLARHKPHQLSRGYFRNNYVFLAYLAVFSLVNIGLFAARCVEYKDYNTYIIIARGCGQCLNFNCAWVLVLMLRRCLTQLRARGFGALLPLDHHIYLHKLTGALVLLYSVVHTLMHLANLFVYVVPDPELNEDEFTAWEWLLTARPRHFGLVAGAANPTGVALLALLLLIFVCSQPFIRRRGSFEVFYWTHLLYVPFWLLLIFHGPNFWKWFVLPGSIYIGEKIVRRIWLRSGRGKTYVSSGILLPSRVTHLVVKRPPLFDFHAGDYVFVNIPAIARYEWHPFTISSAPDQPDYIWLHVRGVGEWTNRLHSYFEREHARLHAPDRNEVCRSVSGGSHRSRRKSSSGAKRSVEFAPTTPSPAGCDNFAFTPDAPADENTLKPPGHGVLLRGASLLTPLRFHKSRSMPDVYDNKRQRHLALRDYMRSESESRFDPAHMRQAAPRGYGALRNRALADSFRYMRNKPAIVAFKTPSQEDCERRRSNESILTLARRRLSKTLSPDKDLESEKPIPETTVTCDESDSVVSPDYPVGKPLEIYVDGPYGAASSHIFRAQHAALIAAGIGVTPFASILQSIMYRYWSARSECPRCHHRYTAALPHHNMNLNKVDFFWINREQRSFEWFVSLLSQLEIEQAEQGTEGVDRFLDMHMYITSALQRTDMKAVGLQLALDLLHEKEKRDLITGLKTRTTAGRPNWDKVFQQLAEQRKGRVTVFYCGPPQLARVLRVKCDAFGFHFSKEVF